MSKKIFFLCFIMTILAFYAAAEKKGQWSCRMDNSEYEIFLEISFPGDGLTVPQHDIFGLLPGYIGRPRNNFVWVITDAQIVDSVTARLDIINDYGSEDLTATLTYINDSTCELRQIEGSQLKMPKNGRWMKIPKTLTLRVRR